MEGQQQRTEFQKNVGISGGFFPPDFFYFFQYDGIKKMKIVKSSRRPATITRQYHHFTAGGRNPQLNDGPSFPNAGPVFPAIVSAPENAVSRSTPKIDAKNAEKIISAK
jgi:hypothetical protein